MFFQQQRLLYMEGVISQVMYSMTAGSFFIGIALIMGASPFVIGLLGALPFLSNMVQIFGVYLVDRTKNRRAIVYWGGWVSRGVLVFIVIGFVFPKEWQLPAFVLFTAIHFLGGAVAGCAWNSWMNDYIPKDRLGDFFSKRMIYTTLAGILATFVISFMLDWSEARYGDQSILPYAVLFGIASIFAIVSNEMIRRIHHPPLDHAVEKFTFKQFKLPFQHRNFRRLILFMGGWNFAFNLAAPFFTVYMLESLHMTMGQVIKYSILSQIVYVMTLKLWGKYSDLYSNKTIIAICGPIFALSLFGWTFTTFPQPHAYSSLIVAILHILIGISTAGINLATNNIALKLCPNDKATLYLATNNMFTSLCAGIAPLIGGALIVFVDHITLQLTLNITVDETLHSYPTLILSHWDFFFTIAMLLGFVTLLFLPSIEESGTAPSRLLLKSMMQDMGNFLHNISTISGLLGTMRGRVVQERLGRSASLPVTD